jgi:predicted amidohydrolase
MLLRCGVVQFQHAAGAKDHNFAVVERFARQAQAEGVKVLAFPEMCLTGYRHARHLDRAGWEDLSEPVPEGPCSQRLLALARETGMVIGAGLVEFDGERLFNTYVVALPDGTWHRHRKLHAFESSHISSGDGFTVFDTPLGVRIGVLICYDTNIVENVRATALLGCDILLAPHQTGGTASRSPHGMKPVDVDLWHNRHVDPEALRREFQGDKGRDWLMRWLPARAHDNGSVPAVRQRRRLGRR